MNLRFLCLFSAVALHAASPLFQGQPDNAWSAVQGSAASDVAIQHNGSTSLRLESSASSHSAKARSGAIHLNIGTTYQISGWVRTEGLSVKDLDRSPIASGASISMESMPFDVHSASLGGTQDWTRVSLRFVATRSEDHILLMAGNGGTLQGKAWFEGVSIDQSSATGNWPAPEAVRSFGPAFRYPTAGWIYLHVEGKPYERGYQHGHLMAQEIPEYLTRCAIELTGKVDRADWDNQRTTADALFLRGFNQEILDEMRGIADGANAAGATFLNRKLDLVDIVVANTTVEMGELAAAMPMTPTGTEGRHFAAPNYGSHPAQLDRCSAFAATGPATRDGKIVIGHVTWWPQNLAEKTNVMLDIQPGHGHRMLIQSYPGGIESGTDWYQNDAGVVLTETTIRQTPFDASGTPVAFRARMAIQYGNNIDDVVRLLETRNNGLYTNEWIIGDAKTNEVALFELGTHHTKLWRSSKNEWFGNTPGFYWGNNNAKDLGVKLEYLPDPQSPPEYVPFVPTVRDLAWMNLYDKYKGQIDEQFAFTAFDSAPLVSMSTMDAKVVTADMANQFMVWGAFGRPNESIAPPGGTNTGLYPGGYTVLHAMAGPAPTAPSSTAPKRMHHQELSWKNDSEKLWKGWVLPAAPEDTWFVAGSAAYYELLQSDDVAPAMELQKIRYRGLKLSPATARTRFKIQQIAGTLFLDSLRQKMGDDHFLSLMRKYFDANTTRTVTAQSFLTFAGTSYQQPDPGEGPAWLPEDMSERLPSAVIVYGTAREAGVNRYAADQLLARYRDRNQREVPLFRDFEASEALLAHKDVIFVGRPETNSALAAWCAKINLHYEAAAFTVNGETYASERNGLVYAAANPLDPAHMILVYAGNSPPETARSISATGTAVALVLRDGNTEAVPE